VFGVGLSELAVIAFIAVLVAGPERLPDLAKQAGQLLRQLRNLANSARDELRTELGPEFADLELRDLDPRTIVRKHIIEAMDDEGPDQDGPPDQPARQRPLSAGEVPPYDVDAT
jgi:sec-independent protein translocase protein TatB